jgi:alpha-L-fucosidase
MQASVFLPPLVLILTVLSLPAQQYVDTAAHQTSRRGNDTAAVELFRDRGLGLFIHWSVDGALGGVISHSLVGASPDYIDRFFRVLPGAFNPDRYQPEK